MIYVFSWGDTGHMLCIIQVHNMEAGKEFNCETVDVIPMGE